MNNLPYDCPTCPQPTGFCFNAGQMGGLPMFGGGEISPDSYTGGQIIWPTGIGHPVPLCTDAP